ncbi:MAG: NAD(P)/FAD-dependent oxidoreductase [Actinomycetota bacterium]
MVGAGHNSLVAAAYLARAGLNVVVCERRDVPGGATVTEEIAPGFRASTASYALSLLRPDVYADLDLARHGLKAVPKDPQMFVPLPDGRSFFVWRDLERTIAELERIHPGDGEAYRFWSAFWEDVVRIMRPVLDSADPVDIERYLGSLGKPDIYRWCVRGSASDIVERFFSAPEVQGAFASQGIVGTWASVRDPGTAWVMTKHALGGDIYGSSGTWGFAIGGMGAVSGAIASAAHEAGADIRCDASVTDILVDGGRAAGVRLSDGTVVRATAVLSGADPKATFLRLCPSGSLDPDFGERVSSWRTPGCVLKVNLALSELPDFIAAPGAGPQHHGTVEISPSLDYLHDAHDDALNGRPSARPWMEVFVASAVDPTLVDGDGHVVSAFTQYVPPVADDWVAMREKAVGNVIDTLASYAPNVPGAIVACEALGPPELEARFGLAGGNIFHGEILPEQSFDKRFDYRTPVDGLYLCGSGARPGGCVTGAAGRNAARTVLADLGR